ncbi:glycosyltransferase [Neobacillus sedimentimangrovi]|jgi:glycosyltransferase involved in cell wall biosynthesis|uniref:Glycosyltransferase family 4 protein n=2 Tax=Neobacillus TaxID=2675232 RepID=A0A6B3TNM4_9BACI|nr:MULTISPECIES: glycosyltransferase [Neobacillus]MCD4838312.1 glycosyltransferase [Neobacillus sedimentimangrovi]NEX78192.1 glycosyltransferase family 4 protein [Neobacillus thermocopriae]
MSKRVGMFVWNHFTNDARVLRECTTLSEAGYDVDLICIHDPKDETLPRFEQRNEHFRVFRLRRYPVLLEFIQKMYRFSLQHKWFGAFCFLLWAMFVYISPVLFLSLTFLAVILLKTKLNVIWVRGSLILRMILMGYKGNYDIYHSNDLNTLPQGYICSKWRLKPKRLIYDSHEVQTSRTGYNSPVYGKMEAFFIKKIDEMIVENHTRAKYNESLYGIYPHVVHNYPFKQTSKNTEKVDLHGMLNIPRHEKILLYQGGIQTGRGLDKLIKAAPLFKEGVLVLIGDGKIKNDLIDMVQQMKLEEKVKFLPKVPLADLPKYTRNAYLGFQVLNNVCFNHYSASSNKLFEYMMAGVPVVACGFPEIKRVVEGDQTGVIVDSHDPESIADGVNWLIDHPEKHSEMKVNAINASQKYNWENEQIHLLNVYQCKQSVNDINEGLKKAN